MRLADRVSLTLVMAGLCAGAVAFVFGLIDGVRGALVGSILGFVTGVLIEWRHTDDARRR